MSYNITFLTKEKHDEWNNFCLESDDSWFWHTTGFLDYCELYAKQYAETQNLSFMVDDGCKIVAVCPLILEKKISNDENTISEFSLMGCKEYSSSPILINGLTEERREKIFKFIFNEVDQLALKHRVSRATYRDSALAIKPYQYNLFMKYGYLDNSINTQVMDLETPTEHLWTNVRKGHKYDIHRGEKNFKTHVYDKNNADKNIFDQYRLLHHKAAGRVTRPIETFEIMYKWMLDGNGMLCGVSKDEKFIGFSYVIIYKNCAVYFSASDDPDYVSDVPISHIIQWDIIKWLKENGYRHYEMGAQQFSSQIHDILNKKNVDISFFKRGFGGRTVPLFRGEKFYNNEYLKKVYKNRFNQLVLSFGE